MFVKELIKQLFYRKRYSSETYIKYLRKKGIRIGEDVTIYVPSKTIIDESYPWMITIGNHVRITEGCKILTHDFAWSVPKTMSGVVLGASGKVAIGDNVFLGMNTIVCRNVQIGDNVIIGAGSIVTHDCEDNSVYAGNPAKKICTIEEFVKKRESLQRAEAFECVREYKKRFGRFPDKHEVGEYFMLWTTVENVDEYRNALEVCKCPERSIEYMKKNPAIYSTYDEFLKDCQ